MKIAIVGAGQPLALRFSQAIESSGAVLSFYDRDERCPLINLSRHEYPVRPLDISVFAEKQVDAAFFFIEARDAILQAEDRGILAVDVAGNFRQEPTVPLTLAGVTKLPDEGIVCLPSEHLHVFGPLLCALQKRFGLKRVNAAVFEPHDDSTGVMPEASSELEMRLINETAKLLDDNQVRITASIYPSGEEQTDYLLNLEFSRPFNMDAAKELMVALPDVKARSGLGEATLIRRLRRDLSADSGLHLFLSRSAPECLLVNNLVALYESLQKTEKN